MNNERIDEILKDSNQHPMAALGALLPEITRLRSLVKAQKEYINCIHVELGTPCWGDAEQLLNQIKQLEQ